MGKVALYYFSGTGNSLHVAKELQKRIPEADLIPMVSLLTQDVIKTNAETVGFIFPIHAFTVPLPVLEFFKKLNPQAASYLFAVATRGGSPCKVFPDINRILKPQGKTLNAHFFINMPNNYLLSFPLPTREEIAQLDSEMQGRIDLIHQTIVNREQNYEKDSHRNWVLENLVFPFLKFLVHSTRYFNMESRFYADSKCNGCGTCEQVCLSGKINIKDNKPVWQKNVKCTFCFACLNYCPRQSVQIGKTKTPEKGRYFHPEITAKDIAGQK